MLKLDTGRGSAYDKSRGYCTFSMPFWDLSLAPTTNDRMAKLGHSGQGLRGVAILAYDPESKETVLGYGMDEPLSLGRIEPDNVVYLDHGDGDIVWGLRRIVDHENGAWTLKHRSGIVVNQQDEMCWAYEQDQSYVVEVKGYSASIPIGRNFNGAGFLSSMYASSKSSPPGNFKKKSESGATFTFPKRTAKGFEFEAVETQSSQGPRRAVLATNIGQRGGWYSDGKYASQLRHIFYMMPMPIPPAPGPQFQDVPTHSRQAGSYVPAGGQAGAGTYTPGGGVTRSPYRPGGETPGGQNRPVDETVAGEPENGSDQLEEAGGLDSDCMVDPRVGAIRADVWFDVAGAAAQLAFEDVDPAIGDDAYSGAFFLGTPSPRPPGYVPADDKSSDHGILEHPDAPEGIRPWIKIPRSTGTPPMCEVQPHFDSITPTYITGGVLPPAHTGGSADAGPWSPPSTVVGITGAAYDFRPGRLTWSHGSIPIASTRTDMRYVVSVPYQLPTLLTGGDEMQFRLFYKVVAGAGETAGTTWTEMSKSIKAGENPTSAEQVKRLDFELPPMPLSQTGGGGRIYFWFMRRSDDSVSKVFRVPGNLQYVNIPATNRRGFRHRRAA